MVDVVLYYGTLLLVLSRAQKVSPLGHSCRGWFVFLLFSVVSDARNTRMIKLRLSLQQTGRRKLKE